MPGVGRVLGSPEPTLGSEIQKTTKAVLSNNSCNAFGARLVVLPLTTNVDSIYPGEAGHGEGKPARIGRSNRSPINPSCDRG
jgi:hypothetical protein